MPLDLKLLGKIASLSPRLELRVFNFYLFGKSQFKIMFIEIGSNLKWMRDD